MDRMMVEHLLRCGYYNTAVKLARQSGIEVGSCYYEMPIKMLIFSTVLPGVWQGPLSLKKMRFSQRPPG